MVVLAKRLGNKIFLFTNKVLLDKYYSVLLVGVGVGWGSVQTRLALQSGRLIIGY